MHDTSPRVASLRFASLRFASLRFASIYFALLRLTHLTPVLAVVMHRYFLEMEHIPPNARPNRKNDGGYGHLHTCLDARGNDDLQALLHFGAEVGNDLGQLRRAKPS